MIEKITDLKKFRPHLLVPFYLTTKHETERFTWVVYSTGGRKEV